MTRRALRTAARFHHLELTREEEDDLVSAWNRLDPYPDVIEGLKRIRSLGYETMAPLTNGDREMVRVGIVERFADMGFLASTRTSPPTSGGRTRFILTFI